MMMSSGQSDFKDRAHDMWLASTLLGDSPAFRDHFASLLSRAGRDDNVFNVLCQILISPAVWDNHGDHISDFLFSQAADYSLDNIPIILSLQHLVIGELTGRVEVLGNRYDKCLSRFVDLFAAGSEHLEASLQRLERAGMFPRLHFARLSYELAKKSNSAETRRLIIRLLSVCSIRVWKDLLLLCLDASASGTDSGQNVVRFLSDPNLAIPSTKELDASLLFLYNELTIQHSFTTESASDVRSQLSAYVCALIVCTDPAFYLPGLTAAALSSLQDTSSVEFGLISIIQCVYRRSTEACEQHLSNFGVQMMKILQESDDISSPRRIKLMQTLEDAIGSPCLKISSRMAKSFTIGEDHLGSPASAKIRAVVSSIAKDVLFSHLESSASCRCLIRSSGGSHGDVSVYSNEGDVCLYFPRIEVKTRGRKASSRVIELLVAERRTVRIYMAGLTALLSYLCNLLTPPKDRTQMGSDLLKHLELPFLMKVNPDAIVSVDMRDFLVFLDDVVPSAARESSSGELVGWIRLLHVLFSQVEALASIFGNIVDPGSAASTVKSQVIDIDFQFSARRLLVQKMAVALTLGRSLEIAIASCSSIDERLRSYLSASVDLILRDRLPRKAAMWAMKSALEEATARKDTGSAFLSMLVPSTGFYAIQLSSQLLFALAHPFFSSPMSEKRLNLPAAKAGQDAADRDQARVPVSECLSVTTPFMATIAEVMVLVAAGRASLSDVRMPAEPYEELMFLLRTYLSLVLWVLTSGEPEAQQESVHVLCDQVSDLMGTLAGFQHAHDPLVVLLALAICAALSDTNADGQTEAHRRLRSILVREYMPVRSDAEPLTVTSVRDKCIELLSSARVWSGRSTKAVTLAKLAKWDGVSLAASVDQVWAVRLLAAVVSGISVVDRSTMHLPLTVVALQCSVVDFCLEYIHARDSEAPEAKKAKGSALRRTLAQYDEDRGKRSTSAASMVTTSLIANWEGKLRARLTVLSVPGLSVAWKISARLLQFALSDAELFSPKPVDSRRFGPTKLSEVYIKTFMSVSLGTLVTVYALRVGLKAGLFGKGADAGYKSLAYGTSLCAKFVSVCSSVLSYLNEMSFFEAKDERDAAEDDMRLYVATFCRETASILLSAIKDTRILSHEEKLRMQQTHDSLLSTAVRFTECDDGLDDDCITRLWEVYLSLAYAPFGIESTPLT